MNDFFWNLFKQSGDINAFMAYREYKRFEETDNGADKGERDSN